MIYRIYHKKYKYEQPFSVDQFGDIFLLFGDFIYEDVHDASPIRVERCSGMNDIHGKLIYENDIVSYELNGKKYKFQLVKYCNKTASFKFGDRYLADSFNYLGGGTGIQQIEITGNIHENN